MALMITMMARPRGPSVSMASRWEWNYAQARKLVQYFEEMLCAPRKPIA
jgi:hypothetical protein